MGDAELASMKGLTIKSDDPWSQHAVCATKQQTLSMLYFKFLSKIDGLFFALHLKIVFCFGWGHLLICVNHFTTCISSPLVFGTAMSCVLA